MDSILFGPTRLESSHMPHMVQPSPQPFTVRSRHSQPTAQAMAGEGAWSPHGFPSPEWLHMLKPDAMALAREFGPLTLALPCIGIDACCHALAGLGVLFSVKYAYDILPYLAGPLTALHRDIDHFHLGSINGDLMLADIASWERVDGVVVGPPCPPWSAIGKGQSWNDKRADVFLKVTDILKDQGKKGAYFFILEMVPGMDTPHSEDPSNEAGRKSQSDCTWHGQTPFEKWLEALTRDAPMWEVHVWTMATQDYLPQHRERLYTVGVNRAAGCMSPRPPPKPRSHERPRLAEMMHPGIPAQELHLPPRLRWHLFMARARRCSRAPWEAPTVHGGNCMAVELDRSPDCTWSVATRYDGCIPTLRTAHRSTWVDINDASLLVSRFLHPIEHLTLQGFPPSVSEGLSPEQVVHVAGNACSVPVVGAVLVQVLSACPRHFQRDVGTDAAPPADRSRQHKRACLQAEIASLQAESFALGSERTCLQELEFLRGRQRAQRRSGSDAQ